jgi:sugar lactone lactonase YvrE
MDPQLQLNDGKTDRRGRFLVGGGDFIHTDMHQIAPFASTAALGGVPGEHLDQLFVTSLDARFLNAPEDSGGATFVISGLGAVGIPDIRFAG